MSRSHIVPPLAIYITQSHCPAYCNLCHAVTLPPFVIYITQSHYRLLYFMSRSHITDCCTICRAVSLTPVVLYVTQSHYRLVYQCLALYAVTSTIYTNVDLSPQQNGDHGRKRTSLESVTGRNSESQPRPSTTPQSIVGGTVSVDSDWSQRNVGKHVPSYVDESWRAASDVSGIGPQTEQVASKEEGRSRAVLESGGGNGRRKFGIRRPAPTLIFAQGDVRKGST